MEILEFAKELGKNLQSEPVYINFKIAEQNSNCDEVLQNDIKAFEQKKVKINEELMKDNMDQKKVDKLNTEISELYTKINENENIIKYNEAKKNLEEVIGKINFILTKSSLGEDPFKIDLEEFENGCGVSCSSCTGC